MKLFPEIWTSSEADEQEELRELYHSTDVVPGPGKGMVAPSAVTVAERGDADWPME